MKRKKNKNKLQSYRRNKLQSFILTFILTTSSAENDVKQAAILGVQDKEKEKQEQVAISLSSGGEGEGGGGGRRRGDRRRGRGGRVERGFLVKKRSYFENVG